MYCLSISLFQYLQVDQACLPHSRGDGFDGSQHGIDELGQLTGRPLSLAAGLDDKPGQGPYVRVKRRLVRHAEFCSSWWAADPAEDREQVSDLITSQVLFIPRAMKASQAIYLCVQSSGRGCVCVCVCVEMSRGVSGVSCRDLASCTRQALLFTESKGHNM